VARIAGVDLPRNKRVEIGLTYIYGIGLASSQNILTKAQVNSDIRCNFFIDFSRGSNRHFQTSSNLSNIKKLRKYTKINTYSMYFPLKKFITNNIFNYTHF